MAMLIMRVTINGCGLSLMHFLKSWSLWKMDSKWTPFSMLLSVIITGSAISKTSCTNSTKIFVIT